MSDIIIQPCIVTYTKDQFNQEALTYRFQSIGFSLNPIRKELRWDVVEVNLRKIRNKIEDLIWKAEKGEDRGILDILPLCRELSFNILPDTGLSEVFPPGFHPQFDTRMDLSAEIPWEVLEETYVACSRCEFRKKHLPNFPHDIKFCEQCGAPVYKIEEKLSIKYFLSHLVTGNGNISRNAKRFLFIIDPKGDLSGQDIFGNICKEHISELRQIIENLGYTFSPLIGKNASSDRVLRFIAAPDLAGIYYFGHGDLSQEGNEGCLELSDRKVYASEIEAKHPTASFVFLNACKSGSTGNNWNLKSNKMSVAEAFAAGGHGSKVVIAPTCPVVNNQAALTALDFFRNISFETSLAEALLIARKNSLDRYNFGKPDLNWMAYRYFGTPDAKLPNPKNIQPQFDNLVTTQGIKVRLFDEQGKLYKKFFAFPVGNTLLRAAKRMNIHNREKITIVDFIGGLFRTGDLTRYIMLSIGINPDHVYQDILSHLDLHEVNIDEKSCKVETAISDDVINEKTNSKDVVKKLISKWIIRRKEQLTSDVIDILIEADKSSQTNSKTNAEPLISEKNILEVFIKHPQWEQLIPKGVPTSENISRLLSKTIGERFVDENGSIVLSNFESNAQKIIYLAHSLSQRMGLYPIKHRVIFTAFLEDEKGVAGTLLRGLGYDPKMLKLFMKMTFGNNQPQSFGLSPESCKGILMHVLAYVQKNASNSANITEKDLFFSFCHSADPTFKRFLKKLPIALDLDEVIKKTQENNFDRDDYEEEVLNIINQSIRFALQGNHMYVLSMHLFLAMLEAPKGPLKEILFDNRIDANKLKEYLLSILKKPLDNRVGNSEDIQFSPHVNQILAKAVRFSKENKVREEELFTAFFDDGGGVVGEILKKMGYHCDRGGLT